MPVYEDLSHVNTGERLGRVFGKASEPVPCSTVSVNATLADRISIKRKVTHHITR